VDARLAGAQEDADLVAAAQVWPLRGEVDEQQADVDGDAEDDQRVGKQLLPHAYFCFCMLATKSSCAFCISAGVMSLVCSAMTHCTPQRSCSSQMRSPQNMSPGGITTVSPAFLARANAASTPPR